MILVRDVFQLHFGKAKEALALQAEGHELEHESGYNVTRVLTDLTGPYYTLVIESTFENLAAFEQATRFSPRWQDWYAKFLPLVREGRREIFRIVE